MTKPFVCRGGGFRGCTEVCNVCSGNRPILPWRVGDTDNDGTTVQSIDLANGDYVADVYTHEAAALIVRAVNNHDDLMAALGTALGLITSHGLATTLAGAALYKIDYDRLEQARAAYTKAES